MNDRNSLDRALGVHSSALQLRARRAELLGDNIANADTPGYLAKDVDFAATLRDAQGLGNLNSSHAAHFSSGSGSSGRAQYRVPVQPAADGNTVDSHLEKSAFTENAVAYQAELEFLGARIRNLLSAIRGE
jgi:flagellar basal-body rod protein FlgB